MPELPEVETVVRQLDQVLKERQISRIQILDPKLKTKETTLLAPGLRNRRCLGVSRIGKWAVLHFEKSLHLAVHLRMTGRLLWHENGHRSEGKPRAVFYFDNGKIVFQDTRRFGILRLVANVKELDSKGVDPLNDKFCPSLLSELLASSKQEIKPWLMRQDRLSGLGNIYASEILFASRIDPRRPARTLTLEEVQRLCRNTRTVLRRAIRNCGVTFSDFQDSKGRMGSYQKFLKVYAKEGKSCVRCCSAISRIVQQQRSTFFCPTCQI